MLQITIIIQRVVFCYIEKFYIFVTPTATSGFQNAMKIKNGWGSSPDHAGGAYSAPQTP